MNLTGSYELTRAIIAATPSVPNEIDRSRAEREAEREEQLARMPLWLRTCVECLMQPYSDFDATANKADAMLDAYELIAKYGPQVDQTGDAEALAHAVINKIAASKPVGWKVRVRASKLIVEHGL